MAAALLEALREVLLQAPDSERFVAENPGDQDAATAAAVLFPIVLREDGLTVLLTQRTDHLKDHPGQISFPGGRVEAQDASPLETALREAEEEIGLARSHVEVLGYLPEYRISTGFRVVPVVAVVRPPFSLRLDPFEVADAFEVPLAFLLDVANHKRMDFDVLGGRRAFYCMPYGERMIWGATAGMIRLLHERMQSAVV